MTKSMSHLLQGSCYYVGQYAVIFDRGSMKEVLAGLASLRLIKYEMILFNNNLKLHIYYTKVIALAASIIGGFGSLKLLSQSNYLFAGAFGNIFVIGILTFTIMFDRTQEITAEGEELKREILVSSTKMRSIRSQLLRQEGEKIVKSVQSLKIRAGVDYVERESTLIFLRYVSEQIVNLLIAF